MRLSGFALTVRRAEISTTGRHFIVEKQSRVEREDDSLVVGDLCDEFISYLRNAQERVYFFTKLTREKGYNEPCFSGIVSNQAQRQYHMS